MSGWETRASNTKKRATTWAGWCSTELAERAGWTGHARARDAAASVFGRYNGLDLMLVKPTTYMNLSGVAVRKVLARQRAPLEDLLVVMDDFDLPLGKIRLREQGSAGTHNGLRSIIGELGIAGLRAAARRDR